MSDASQGPGWWQASDGKWYPPQPQPAATPPGGGASGSAPGEPRRSCIRPWVLVVCIAAAAVVGATLATIGSTEGEDPEDLRQALATANDRISELEDQLAESEGVDTTESEQVEEAETTSTTAGDSSDVAGTRDNPIPFGQPGAVGDWEVTVVGTTPDAWPQVQAENQFNDPPPPGFQDYMAELSFTYTGSDEPQTPFWSLSTSVLGQSNVAHEEACGVIPNDYQNVGDVYTGGNSVANVCHWVESVDISTGLLVIETSDSDQNRVFFSLS